MTVNADLIAAVVTRLGTVTNIGQVHNRPRLKAGWSEFLDTFKSTIATVDQIRGAWVTWDGVPETVDEAAFGELAEVNQVTAHMVLGLSDGDSTQGTFNDLVEATKNALRSQDEFGISSLIVYSTAVLVPVNEIRQFGDVLCHYAEIQVRVISVETPTFS